MAHIVRTMRHLPLFILLAFLAGCSDARSDGKPEPATKAQIENARAVMASFEAEQESLPSLPPSQRAERLRTFGARLEAGLTNTANTRFENKNLLWLASWRYAQADGEGLQLRDARRRRRAGFLDRQSLGARRRLAGERNFV